MSSRGPWIAKHVLTCAECSNLTFVSGLYLIGCTLHIYNPPKSILTLISSTKPALAVETKRSETPISPPNFALHIENGTDKDGSTSAMFVRYDKSTTKWWFAELTTHSDYYSLVWLFDLRVFEELTTEYDGVKWNDEVTTDGLLDWKKIDMAWEAYKGREVDDGVSGVVDGSSNSAT